MRAARLLPLTVCMLAACAPVTVASPRATALAFAAASRANDTAALYALLPAATRRVLPYTDFVSRTRDTRDEIASLGTQVATALASGTTPTAALDAHGRDPIAVSDDRDGWHVRASGLDHETPLPSDAVRALRSALRSRDLPALLAALDAEGRGAVLAEIESLADGLGDALTSADEASTQPQRTIELRGGRRLRLVREGPNWRVQLE